MALLNSIRAQQIIDIDAAGYLRLGANSGSYAWRAGAEAGAFVLRNATSSPLTSTGTAVITISAANAVSLVGALSCTALTASGLTSGRVPFVSTGGLLVDDADFTFATDTLTVTKATIGGISHIANAITAANSVTASALTDLTLTGGSSGASLTLSQGSSGTATVALGTNSIILNPKIVSSSPAVNFSIAGVSSGIIGAASVGEIVGGSLTGDMVFRSKSGNSFLWTVDGGTNAAMKLVSTGNLLIGTTSETGLTGSGGLKINSSTAASTTSAGALVVGGGIAAGAASFFGGDITRTGAIAGGPQIKVLGSDTASFATIQVGTSAGDAGTIGARLLLSDAGTSGVRWDVGSGSTTAGVLTFKQATSGVVAMNITAAATNTGSVAIPLTLAGSAGAGALVVTGGLATGAASYIGGNLTVSGTGQSSFGAIGQVTSSILVGATNTANGAAAYISIAQQLNYGFPLFGINITGTAGSDSYTSPKTSTGGAAIEFQGGASGITKFLYHTGATTAGNTVVVSEAGRFTGNNFSIGGNLTVSGTGGISVIDTSGTNVRINALKNTAPALSHIAQVTLGMGVGNGFGANDRTWQLVATGVSSTETRYTTQYWNGTSYAEHLKLSAAGTLEVPGTGSHVFGTAPNTVTLAAGAVTATGQMLAPSITLTQPSAGAQLLLMRDETAGTRWSLDLTGSDGFGVYNLAGSLYALTLANTTGNATFAGSVTALYGTAIPAGGTAGSGLMVSSTANFGVFFGSGAPTLSAAKGSLYLRSDGSGTSDRMYVNTNGTTGWAAVTTAS